VEFFFERYEVLKILGEGATATVYLAWDRCLSRFVAIKAGKEKELLFREAECMASIHSTYFPVIHDCMESCRQVYLVMEYVEGENLLQRKGRIGRYTEAEVLSIALQVAEAMAELHKGKKPKVYGDIKPENTMMQPDGKIKVVDFGTVLTAGSCKEASDCVRGGTLTFAAPEQWKEPPDIRNDIYGLGMLMRNLLSHEGELCCSAHVRSIIERCTQKEKEKRFRDMEEVKIKFLTKNVKNVLTNI